jgi:hypothetical protein
MSDDDDGGGLERIGENIVTKMAMCLGGERDVDAVYPVAIRKDYAMDISA